MYVAIDWVYVKTREKKTSMTSSERRIDDTNKFGVSGPSVFGIISNFDQHTNNKQETKN